MGSTGQRTIAVAVGLAVMGALVAGCHESEIEPRAPIADPWEDDGSAEWERPVFAMSQADIPPAVIADPAPVLVRPRSISLGFVGDEPLTPSPVMPPRWPWVQERFHLQPAYAYGYGIPRRLYRRPRR